MAWRGEARQAGDERADVARFCHLIHIITGVFLLYGGGELIASITVSSCLHLLGSSAGFLPPAAGIKLKVLRQSSSPSFVSDRAHLNNPLAFPVSYLCTHGVAEEQVPPEPSSVAVARRAASGRGQSFATLS